MAYNTEPEPFRGLAPFPKSPLDARCDAIDAKLDRLLALVEVQIETMREVKAIFAKTSPPTEAPNPIPAGYKKLPDGVRCRCIKLFVHGAEYYCCNPGAHP